MNELPKSVRDELARQQQAGVAHPDADLLTAFAEGSATPEERTRLEQHLATCGECREVLFLAAPASEAVAPLTSLKSESTRRWLPSWLPWTAAASAAAAVLLVATFTLSKNQPPRMSMAKNEPAATALPAPPVQQDGKAVATDGPLPSESAPQPSIVNSTPVVTAKAKDADSLNDRRDKQALKLDELKKESASKDIAQPTGAIAGGIVLAPAPPPPSRPAASQQEREMYAYKAQAQARNSFPKSGPAAPAQNQMTQNQANQNRVAEDSAAAKPSQSTVEVLSQADEVRTAKVEGQISAAPNAFSLSRARSEYRISSDGKLERLDAGTWIVAVAQPGTKFTVVAVIGPIVWAGGTHSTLLRSMDNGASWQSIHLPNIATEATITRIEFHDAFSGKVSTSDRHSWTTSDRGESWQQP